MALAHYPPSDRQLASIGSYSSSYPDSSPMYSLSQFMGGISSSHVDQPYVSSVSSYLSEGRSQWQPGLSTPYPSLSISGVSPYSSPSSSQLSYPPEYPESAQRSALSDALRPSSSSRSYTSALGPSSPRDTPTLQRASWGSALYVVDSAEPEPALAPSPVPEPLSPASQVKEEDFEGSFIFELAASDALHGGLESMPEVPLRATHAPKAMRKMMGSFRLDPFAMHNGIRSAAVAAAPVGIEVGPLREEPVMFEFQVHLDYPLVPPSPRWSPARSASPLLYPLEDEPEEKWVASMGSYSPFEAGAVAGAGFAPLMTPAQSLNWSMSYQQQEASDALSASPASSSGYPVQPLSIFRSGQSQPSQPSSHAHSPPSYKSDAHTSSHSQHTQSSSPHAHGYSGATYAERDVPLYRSQRASAAASARCQQEYSSEYAPVVPGAMSWYRKTLAIPDGYMACT